MMTLYYSFFFLSLVITFFAWDKRLPLSVSNTSLIALHVLVSFPGFFVAFRMINYFQDNEGFLKLYWLFLLSMLIPPIGIFLGKTLAKKIKIFSFFNFPSILRYQVNKRTQILATFVILYSIFYYLYWFDSIPLFQFIIHPTMDKAALAVLRNSLTHDILNIHKSFPFVLRYWRLFMYDIGLYIFLVLYSQKKYNLSNKPTPKYLVEKQPFVNWLFYPLLLILVTNCLMNFEKARIIYFLFSMITIDLVYKRIRLFMSLKITLIIIILPLTYFLFMGSRGVETLASPLYRILRQTEGVCEQYVIYNSRFSSNMIGFANYSFGLWDKVLNKNHVDLSKEAYKVKYPQYFEKYNITGTTGTLHLFQNWTSFGLVFGSITYFIFSCLLGLLSFNLSSSIILGNNIYFVPILPLFSIFFSNVLVRGTTSLFTSSILINPQLILYLLLMITCSISIAGKRNTT